MNRRKSVGRGIWLGLALVVLAGMFLGALLAPEFLSRPDLSARSLSPTAAPPFGTNTMGIPLAEYALQGAKIVALPSLLSGAIVMFFATIAGLLRCAGLTWLDNFLQMVSELVGAIPRLVVILVVAVAMPETHRGLIPIGIAWALLASPGAMDEAAATAGRLGGERFVEALRAHGFNAPRIYLYHIVWMNLRAVIVRQGAEVLMQVVFLEIALSYLAVSQRQPAFTHHENINSWATLLYDGYSWLVAGVPMAHAMVLGIALVALTAFMAQGFRLAARER